MHRVCSKVICRRERVGERCGALIRCGEMGVYCWKSVSVGGEVG